VESTTKTRKEAESVCANKAQLRRHRKAREQEGDRIKVRIPDRSYEKITGGWRRHVVALLLEVTAEDSARGGAEPG
jgi:hypothetical protein